RTRRATLTAPSRPLSGPSRPRRAALEAAPRRATLAAASRRPHGPGPSRPSGPVVYPYGPATYQRPRHLPAAPPPTRGPATYLRPRHLPAAPPPTCDPSRRPLSGSRRAAQQLSSRAALQPSHPSRPIRKEPSLCHSTALTLLFALLVYCCHGYP
ncbi:unnamed protein product, partial [Closterium sp. NIES-53]